ncbi:MAG TPA: RNA methyltransferase [Gemmatimonadaceae bacterium]|nr:RNA methyltransferase [Gemmatimonadaceae bacterium]
MKILTLARDLRRRKAREKQGLFVAEGVRAVEELLRSPLTIRGSLVAPQLMEAPRGAALAASLRGRTTVEEVGPLEFASAAETESPQGVIAIAEIPPRSLGDVDDGWSGVILVLDAVQDPGNVGTILRTAAAFGAVATVALPGTVDLWNAKVVRSGMGAHFGHPAFSTTWGELDAFRSSARLTILAADAAGETISSAHKSERIALVVGNEGSGLSPEARARADRLVSLPIQPGVESLNVAVATGVLLYLLAH